MGTFRVRTPRIALAAVCLSALLATGASCADRPTPEDPQPACSGPEPVFAGTPQWASCGPIPAAPTAPGCHAAGGACVGRGTCSPSCVAAEHAAECRFDDGPGECCVAPAPARSGDRCADLGGVCAPIAGCGMVVGWRMGASDCTNVGFMCCVPQARCEDADVVCCGDTWASMTACVRGTFACEIPDHVLMCWSDCAPLLP